MENEELLYDVSIDWDARAIKARTLALASDSSDEINQILSQNCKAVDVNLLVQIQNAIRNHLKIEEKGAGTDPGTVALLVSLTPFVKAIVPLLKPFAENMADVARKIALDIWNMLKKKLGDHEHIRLRNRK